MKLTRPGRSRRGVHYLYIGFGLLIFYWLMLRKRVYTQVFETIVSGEPKTVWEFISDFTNQKLLNPTIEDFEINYEKGNYDNWEYGVTYSEHFAVIPFFSNVNHGIFKVTPEKGKEPFRIATEHNTCFFRVFCITTVSEMIFNNVEILGKKQIKKTQMTETVHFECPTFLLYICRKELNSQKGMIYENLKSIDMNI